MAMSWDRYAPATFDGTERYQSGARWFHWLTAILIFAIVPLGWIFAEFKTEGKPPTGFEAPLPGAPGDYAMLHKTLGLLALALVVARLVYRFANRPPVLPRHTTALETGLSHATHWLLYLLLLAMPISGYIMSSASDHPISLLGLFDVPKLPIPKDVGKVANKVHVFAQFALYALVLAHIAGVAWHLFVRRDNLLARMLPAQDGPRAPD